MKKALMALVTSVALAVACTFLSVTPVAIATPKAEAASYTSCYMAMDGSTWCYRYGCSWFETVALGCRDGWVRTSTTWYAGAKIEQPAELISA